MSCFPKSNPLPTFPFHLGKEIEAEANIRYFRHEKFKNIKVRNISKVSNVSKPGIHVTHVSEQVLPMSQVYTVVLRRLVLAPFKASVTRIPPKAEE
jgi:hypothetical protein